MATGRRRSERGERAAPLDGAFLERLAEHIGAEVVDELLADALIEIEDRLAALAVAAEQEDRPRARALVHDLVATAGHVGLGPLSAAAAAAERRLRAGGNSVAACVAAVCAAGPATLEALRAALAERRPDVLGVY